MSNVFNVNVFKADFFVELAGKRQHYLSTKISLKTFKKHFAPKVSQLFSPVPALLCV